MYGSDYDAVVAMATLKSHQHVLVAHPMIPPFQNECCSAGAAFTSAYMSQQISWCVHSRN